MIFTRSNTSPARTFLVPGIRRLGLATAATLALGGCAFSPDAVAREKSPPGPAPESGAGDTSRATRSAGQLQRAVMDFSDHYVSALWLAFDEYIKSEKDARRRTNAQKWKVMLGATSMTIAGSQDPRAALLDMAVFISAGKWAVDRHWIPEVFGEDAAPLREVYRRMDRKIWDEVEKVLTPAQQADLRRLIAAWKETDPPRNELLDVRLRNLDGVELENFAETNTARGLLASIQRLLGRVDQSLLYGERMIFYMERVPRMLAQQSDLTVDRVAERFPIATINPDFSGLSAMVENLPDQIESLLQDEQGLAAKLPEVRASIESVERLTASLQQTFDNINILSSKIEQLPFEREDYVSALQESSTALTQLNALVENVNRLVDSGAAGEAGVARLASALNQSADEFLDKAFRRGLMLIGVFFAGILLSLVAARVLFPRKSGTAK